MFGKRIPRASGRPRFLGTSSLTQHRPFRVLKHLLTLAAVPGPSAHPGGSTWHLHLAKEEMQAEECQGEKGEIEKHPGHFLSHCLVRGAWGTDSGAATVLQRGGDGEERIPYPYQSLAPQAFRDLWVRWLPCVFHYRHPGGYSCGHHPSLRGLSCTCSASPATGPALASVQGLHSLSQPEEVPRGASWQQVGSALGHFYLPPVPFQALSFQMLAP